MTNYEQACVARYETSDMVSTTRLVDACLAGDQEAIDTVVSIVERLGGPNATVSMETARCYRAYLDERAKYQLPIELGPDEARDYIQAKEREVIADFTRELGEEAWR